MNDAFDRIARLAAGPLDGQGLDRATALELLDLAQRDPWAMLYQANRIRERHRGRVIRLCGIVAAKLGRCGEDCKWCSQSARHQTDVKPHALLDSDELLRRAREAAARGVDSFGFVTSGAKPTVAELDRLCGVIVRLRDEGRLTSCASLGLLDEAGARQLAAAGCRRYNHNLETSRRHYAKMVSTHKFDDRVATARAVKAAGLELCCGGLFGMGETWEDRVDLALELRAVEADTVPVNFLNPIPGTPLGDAPRLEPREGLKILALMRFLLPTRCIKVAGGRETCLRDLQSWMFYAGADSAILGNYLTPAGRAAEEDLRMIADLGLTVAAHEAAGDCPRGAIS
jgi:biotin synthase